jgi:hypothetical protein
MMRKTTSRLQEKHGGTAGDAVHMASEAAHTSALTVAMAMLAMKSE